MATIKYSTGFRNENLKAGGKSKADILANGCIHLFGGSMPTNADSTEGSSPLVIITLASGAFTFGNTANGIEFDVAANGILAQKSGEVWSGVGLVAGTITWGRFYGNAGPAGASTTAFRLDFDVNTSGAALNMGNTTVSVGGTVTINSPTLTDPATVIA